MNTDDQKRELTPEEEEALRRIEEARQRIVQLEAVLAEKPKDVPTLTELMRAYRVVGDDENREKVMYALRDIPSKGDIREMAKAFLADVRDLTSGELVNLGGLRRKYAPLFEVVESRQEIRPGDIMAATGCGCSFAIDVLKAFARLGIVSKDLSLGLRKVFDCRSLQWMIVHDGAAPCQAELPPQIMKHYDEALATVREMGECKISVIMRKTGLGYNASAALADYISSHIDCR